MCFLKGGVWVPLAPGGVGYDMTTTVDYSANNFENTHHRNLKTVTLLSFISKILTTEI
jgi:hypothetical protein